MTTQTAPRYEKEIRYSPEDRDYLMLLDGQPVGFARTHHEAEIALDELIHSILIHGGASTPDTDETPEPAACDHYGTGRDVLVSPSYEVIASCLECHQMLDVLQCRDPLEAKLTALRELGEPLDDRTLQRMSIAAFQEIFDAAERLIGEHDIDADAVPDELLTIRDAARKALTWLGASPFGE